MTAKVFLPKGFILSFCKLTISDFSNAINYTKFQKPSLRRRSLWQSASFDEVSSSGRNDEKNKSYTMQSGTSCTG